MRITRAQSTDGRVYRHANGGYHVTGKASSFSPSSARPAASTLAATSAELNPLPAGISQSLGRILRPQAAYRWLLPSLAAMTPQYIEMVLRSALAGDHVRQWELFDLMLDTWPELAACSQELSDGVSGLKLIVEPYAEEDEDPTATAKERCKLASSALRRMAPQAAADENDLEGTLLDIVDGWFRGVTVLETEWHAIDSPIHGAMIAPRCTFWVHPVCFAFDGNGRLGLRVDSKGSLSPANLGGTATQGAGSAVVGEFPQDKFLIGIHKAKSGSALGGALLRPLAWWWCAANFSADWLLNLAQVFGLPFRWANYDPTAPEETVSRICSMLQNMGSAGWAAFPAGTTLELKESTKTGDHSPQGELLDRADRYARLLILGQTLSGSQDASKGGGKAFGSVEADVKAARIEAAGRYACRVLNTQLIPSILTLNYGDADEAPTVRLLEDKEGGYEEAQRDQILAQIMPLSANFLRKKFGQPEPEDAADSVGGAPVAAPATPGDADGDGDFDENDAKQHAELIRRMQIISDRALSSTGKPAKKKTNVKAAAARLAAIEDDAVFGRELQILADQIEAGGFDTAKPGHWVTIDDHHVYLTDRGGSPHTALQTSHAAGDAHAARDLPTPPPAHTGPSHLVFSVKKAKGYSGMMAEKSYLAAITGTDPQTGFSREFAEADSVDWGDSQLFKRSKGTWKEEYHVGEGLYEHQQYGERSHRMVFRKADGSLAWKAVDPSRAKAIAQHMEDGKHFDEARRLTAPVAALAEAIECGYDADEERDADGKWTGGGEAKPETIKPRAKLNLDQAARLLKQRGYKLGDSEWRDGATIYQLINPDGASEHRTAQELQKFLTTDHGRMAPSTPLK